MLESIRLSLWGWSTGRMCFEVGFPLVFYMVMLADGLGMPDFVYSTTGSEFTNKFRDQILSYDRKY